MTIDKNSPKIAIKIHYFQAFYIYRYMLNVDQLIQNLEKLPNIVAEDDKKKGGEMMPPIHVITQTQYNITNITFLFPYTKRFSKLSFTKKK